MTLTRRNNQYFREVPMDPAIVYAAETPTASLFAVHRDGRVVVDVAELSDADSLALHDYAGDFTGYPVPHSGEWKCVTESNGYITGAWMGATPVQNYGQPIYIGVRKPDGEVFRYLLHFAGAVLDTTAKRGLDNHCIPQLFLRESDKRVVYLSGGHNTTLYAGVSSTPHAAWGFHSLHPVGPQSRYTSNGHTYPAARLVGDTLHVVSRFLDGEYSLVYWSIDTKTMQPGKSQVIDKAPDSASYCIWYQQPRVEGDTLIIETNRRHRVKGETALSDPVPATFEVQL